MITRKWKRKLAHVVGLIGTASFILPVNIYPLFPSFAFFEIFLRIFQFASGASLAAIHFSGNLEALPVNHEMSSVFIEASSGIAFLCLFASYALQTSNASLAHMLLVTLSTVTLVAQPKSYLALNLLSSSPIHTVGLLAYSAYLVHWPLFVLYDTLLLD